MASPMLAYPIKLLDVCPRTDGACAVVFASEDSAGDHDGVENVIHLMLARIKGAPAGVKGISLFVVPQKRIGANGDLEPNDLNVAGIFHKLGYRGAPITQLGMGEQNGCRGWLVGEPHKGLSYMFRMMNEARIDVGLSAAAISSAAYYASLEYALERTQGRKPGGKDPPLPPVPIIEHADVKRMLLFQRSVVEGSLSLILQCALYADQIPLEAIRVQLPPGPCSRQKMIAHHFYAKSGEFRVIFSLKTIPSMCLLPAGYRQRLVPWS